MGKELAEKFGLAKVKELGSGLMLALATDMASVSEWSVE